MSAVAKNDWHFTVRLAELVFLGSCIVFGFLLLYLTLWPIFDW